MFVWFCLSDFIVTNTVCIGCLIKPPNVMLSWWVWDAWVAIQTGWLMLVQVCTYFIIAYVVFFVIKKYTQFINTLSTTEGDVLCAWLWVEERMLIHPQGSMTLARAARTVDGDLACGLKCEPPVLYPELFPTSGAIPWAQRASEVKLCLWGALRKWTVKGLSNVVPSNFV